MKATAVRVLASVVRSDRTLHTKSGHRAPPAIASIECPLRVLLSIYLPLISSDWKLVHLLRRDIPNRGVFDYEWDTVRQPCWVLCPSNYLIATRTFLE
jgi:hypothetical protein